MPHNVARASRDCRSEPPAAARTRLMRVVGKSVTPSKLTWIMDFLFSAESWAALLTLTVLEIVLGIDNIVFISILAGKLPHGQQHQARQLGLSLALITR